MNAIDELLNEHEAVRLALKVLKKISHTIETTGDIADTDDMAHLFEFLKTFVDQCHHGKEEELLFPALEKVGISCEGGPVGVMLKEHQQGRDLVIKMKRAWAQYIEGDADAAGRFKRYSEDYIALLNFHIDKENNVLFPLARKHLQDNVLLELQVGFDRIETERVGAGKHERFHDMLDSFERIYLR